MTALTNLNSFKYPLLQAVATQDKIRALIEFSFELSQKGKHRMAYDAAFRARESVNKTSGNRNVYRMIAQYCRHLETARNEEFVSLLDKPA